MESDTVMECVVRPVAGRAFEDILDGYFPLGESVRQLMERHDFASVWLTLLHAPVMNIRELAPTEPVPLSLRKTYSGMIDWMSLVATRQAAPVRMNGMGDWFWVDGREEADTFPGLTRLGEPTFVRGIGVNASSPGDDAPPLGATVAVARIGSATLLRDGLGAATAALGWSSSRAWGLGSSFDDGIHHARIVDAGRSILGDRISAAGNGLSASFGKTSAMADDRDDYILLDISPRQPDAEARELALIV